LKTAAQSRAEASEEPAMEGEADEGRALDARPKERDNG
jgi:hypothetical protein